MALNSASGGHAGSPLAEQETTDSWRSIGAQSIKSRRSSNEERRPTPELPNANTSCPIQRCDRLTSIHYRDQGIKNSARRPLRSAQRSQGTHPTCRRRWLRRIVRGKLKPISAEKRAVGEFLPSPTHDRFFFSIRSRPAEICSENEIEHELSLSRRRRL